MAQKRQADVLSSPDNQSIAPARRRTALKFKKLSDYSRPGRLYRDEVVYRFSIHQIERMIDAMRLPDTITTNDNVVVPIDVAMGMLLYRLSVQDKLMEIHTWFEVHPTVCSRVISEMVDMLISMFDDFIEWWPGLTTHKVNEYREGVNRRDPRIRQIWAFIDQKYHSLVTPDGLCVSNRGIIGVTGSASQLLMNEISTKVAPITAMPDGTIAYLFGDTSCRSNQFITFPFIHPSLREELKIRYNALILNARVDVETQFANQFQQWYALELDRNKRLCSKLISNSALFKLCTLFTNCQTCLNGSLASVGAIQPPTLEQYLM